MKLVFFTSVELCNIMDQQEKSHQLVIPGDAVKLMFRNIVFGQPANN